MEKNINSESLISTPRLQREVLSMKYIEDIFKELTDEVTKMLRVPTPKSIEEEIERVISSQEKMKQWSLLNFVVTDKEKNFIWTCGIIHLDTSTPEMGAWIKQSARGKGYGKEMVGGLINRLENNKKFEYIVHGAHKENIGSRKIADHFGWVLQVDEEGKEKINIEYKFDKSSSFEAVEYRIYPKAE